MYDTRRFRPAVAGLLFAAGACGGGGGEGEEEAVDTVALGYYTYSDASRGLSHLALLTDHRFLFVHEPPTAAVPAAGAEALDVAPPAVGTAGDVGWYLIRGDSVFLNSERMYARGTLGPEVIRLVFVTPLVPGSGGEDYELTFQRQVGEARPPEGQGGGGEQGGGGQGGGGQEGGGGGGGGGSGG